MHQSDQFSLFEVLVDGRRLIANVDLSLRTFADKKDFPWFLSVSTALTEPDANGLPTKAEAEALNSWEDEVEAAIASATNFKYVGRVSWNCYREILYQLEQPEEAASVLQRLIDHGTTRPFAFHCQRDDSWGHVANYLAE